MCPKRFRRSTDAKLLKLPDAIITYPFQAFNICLETGNHRNFYDGHVGWAWMQPPRQRVEVDMKQDVVIWSRAHDAASLRVCVYLAQTSREMWKSILSWWAAGSSSSMAVRRFRLSSERLSALLRGREAEWREDVDEEEDEGCGCRSWKGSFRSTLSWKAGLDTGSGTL